MMTNKQRKKAAMTSAPASPDGYDIADEIVCHGVTVDQMIDRLLMDPVMLTRLNVREHLRGAISEKILMAFGHAGCDNPVRCHCCA